MYYIIEPEAYDNYYTEYETYDEAVDAAQSHERTGILILKAIARTVASIAKIEEAE